MLQVITFSFILVAFAIVLQILARSFRHPLSRFPGPLLAKWTVYYRAYHDIYKNGGWLRHLEVLHAVYGKYFIGFLGCPLHNICLGPIVRVGPNEVSLGLIVLGGRFLNPSSYTLVIPTHTVKSMPLVRLSTKILHCTAPLALARQFSLPTTHKMQV